MTAVELSIVPISVGYLGDDMDVIEAYGRVVGELLLHLEARSQRPGEQATAAPAAPPAAGAEYVKASMSLGDGPLALNGAAAGAAGGAADSVPLIPLLSQGRGRNSQGNGIRGSCRGTSVTSSHRQWQETSGIEGHLPYDPTSECVVLIATSDLTHAGPWYREVPPPGVSLECYMRTKDLPVIQVGLGVYKGVGCWVLPRWCIDILSGFWVT
jgi:hypothetical protein